MVRHSSAAAQSASSAQLPSPYPPVDTACGLRNVTFGYFPSHVHAFSAACKFRSANAASNGLYARAAIAITAARSPVAHDVLNGSVPLPTT